MTLDEAIIHNGLIFIEKGRVKMDSLLKAYVVSAFTHNNKGGNKAGVVINADNLTEDKMQFIAKKLNFSETAFVISSKDPSYDYEVRFFTPATEVDLCGHATIGTFYTLGSLGYITPSEAPVKLKQKTLAGILEVEVHFQGNKVQQVLMTQASPKFYPFSASIEELAEILSITPTDIGVEGMDSLPMIVSTGLKDIILPVKSLNVLKSINPNFELLKTYISKTTALGIHVFTLETEHKEHAAATRNFAPNVDIDEESATGTSNGALCAYLMKYNLLPYENTLSITCEQGYYMNNPSSITCIGTITDEGYLIKVGGTGTILNTLDLD